MMRIRWKNGDERCISGEDRIDVESKALGFSETRHTFDNIWRGIVPPRVEMMGWFLILGKLNTMKRLAQINVVGANEVTCALCGLDDEDIDHLFIHCNYVSQLLYKAMVMGGITWVKPKGVRSFFESWCEQEVVRVGRRRWINYWFAMVWVIWRIRNQFIFERKDISWENAWEFIMHQLKEWETLNKKRKKEQSTIVQWATNSRVNALVECIETSVQFVLEKCSAILERVVFKTNEAILVRWAKGQGDNYWRLNFERNKLKNFLQSFNNFKILYASHKELKFINNWKKMVNNPMKIEKSCGANKMYCPILDHYS
ncbi:hypothetical protein Ahy_B01g052183 [Arachis hypogaea]|uniref:Reverse transcriptase zinc-binding domain-containing protein n=1 Tax=Arachis hypogaea TaxID=3818 RepID=A0A445ANS0_ARAHY|nr:hypothetical protein Ahy_B01g052183 [Arachis hypogaea]